MSHILFRSEEGVAKVSGAERAAMGLMADRSLFLATGVSPLQRLSGPPPPVDSWFVISLNTMLALGNDALQLAARLHGQCEVHCWVDGPNREWLAGLVDKACRVGIFRRSFGLPTGYGGWPAVIDLLRQSSVGPVVTSYSVTDTWKPGTALHPIHELKPDGWDGHRFDSGTTGFDLR